MYLTLGATIFYFIESYYENEKIEEEKIERITIYSKKIMSTIIAGIGYLARKSRRP